MDRVGIVVHLLSACVSLCYLSTALLERVTIKTRLASLRVLKTIIFFNHLYYFLVLGEVSNFEVSAELPHAVAVAKCMPGC